MKLCSGDHLSGVHSDLAPVPPSITPSSLSLLSISHTFPSFFPFHPSRPSLLWCVPSLIPFHLILIIFPHSFPSNTYFRLSFFFFPRSFPPYLLFLLYSLPFPTSILPPHSITTFHPSLSRITTESLHQRFICVGEWGAWRGVERVYRGDWGGYGGEG